MIALVALWLMLAAALPVGADGVHVWEDDNHSHDLARRALERGEIMPVGKVIAILHSKVQGEIVATEYEHEFGHWVYQFKVIDPQGHLRKIHINAASGEMIEGKHN